MENNFKFKLEEIVNPNWEIFIACEREKIANNHVKGRRVLKLIIEVM
jgi:hypothetical protein